MFLNVIAHVFSNLYYLNQIFHIFFPDGAFAYEEPQEDLFHFLVLTDIHGNKSHAVCLTTYKEYSVQVAHTFRFNTHVWWCIVGFKTAQFNEGIVTCVSMDFFTSTTKNVHEICFGVCWYNMFWYLITDQAD